MQKRTILFIVIFAVAGLAVIFAIRTALNNSNAKEVELEQPVARTIKPSILTSGQLVHEDEVHLTSEVIGKVKALYVEEGRAVTAGQLVLEIDDESFFAQVEQNQAAVRLQEIDIERRQLNINNLARRFKRSNSLFEQNLLDDNSFEAAQHELNLARVDLKAGKEHLVQARAQLEQAQDRLDKTRITSPIDGVITWLDIEVGETAISSTTNVPGSRLMTIANPASIITELYVDEADVADIELGQTAEIIAIAYPDKPLTGQVEFIANTAQTVQGRQGLSFLVRLRITDTNGVQPRPGMSCRAAIFTHGEDEALSLPVQAILVEEDAGTKAVNYFVYVAREGVAKKVDIETGISDDEYQAVTQGLTLNDRVVIGPGRTLRRLKEDEAIMTAEDDS
ncbi:MAG: efflux RND transporter periplasmic adaptor subunit [Pseudomonadota bacterium]